MSQPLPGAAEPPHCYRHPQRETWIRCQRCDRPICADCMNSASVGFQCPQCLKEGSRSTRSGQMRFGGGRITNAQTTTIGLIGANVVVWLLVLATGGNSSSLLGRLALTPLGQCVTANGNQIYIRATSRTVCASATPGRWIPGVADGAVWQVVTSVFTHVEPLHIGFNMLALWFLGPPVEAVLGRARFLTVYAVSGLAGSAAVMLFSSPQTQTLGASGAIFGLMGALVVIGLKMKADLRQLWFWIGLNLVFTFTAGGISWQGHIGGLLGGAATAAVIVYAPRASRTQVQVAGSVGLGLLSVVVIALRMIALGG